MLTIGVANQKGGSGKSTVACSLAVEAETHGHRTLVIDLDPQQSIGLWHQVRGTNKPMVRPLSTPEDLGEMLQSAARLGVTLAILDAPSKIDSTTLACIRAADIIVSPTMADLFNLGSLQDTVRLLEVGGKLDRTIAVINGVSEAGSESKIDEAKKAIASFKMQLAPVIVHHRSAFQTAVEKGMGVTELGPRGAKAADEIRALWKYLERYAKQLDARPLTGKAKAKTKVRAQS
jgi:chromosome partitioning protein